MPNHSLRTTLSELATSFAESVVAAIRLASIDELAGESSGTPRRGPGRPPGGGTSKGNPGKRSGGRLQRRSAEDIAKALDGVVALVKKSSKTGMRSEEIRKALALDVREVPRILKEGLAKKKLRSKGRKRSTTYFAA